MHRRTGCNHLIERNLYNRCYLFLIVMETFRIPCGLCIWCDGYPTCAGDDPTAAQGRFSSAECLWLSQCRNQTAYCHPISVLLGLLRSNCSILQEELVHKTVLLRWLNAGKKPSAINGFEGMLSHLHPRGQSQDVSSA